MKDPNTHDQGAQLKLLSREMVHKLNNMIFVISSYSQFIRETHIDDETISNLQRIEIAVQQSQEVMEEWRKKADELIPDPPGT